ncbi:MAG: hypothetical protein ED554_00020 [Synechococcus sp. YX04-3]|nr:MAG: hypothetical protein ED554_00020 [Synechococcus sp. YX04-3]
MVLVPSGPKHFIQVSRLACLKRFANASHVLKSLFGDEPLNFLNLLPQPLTEDVPIRFVAAMSFIEHGQHFADQGSSWPTPCGVVAAAGCVQAQPQQLPQIRPIKRN